MAVPVRDEKAAIRARVRASRRARTVEQAAADRIALGSRLAELAVGLGARSVSCYLPIAGEPDPTRFVEWAREIGVEVLLPAMRDDGMLDWIVSSGAGEYGAARGAFGISEPLGERLPPTRLGEVDLVIAPACAVDESGVRLGWGRGYYDRTLGALDRRPPVYAVVHDDEVFVALPREAHDVPISGAVTPGRILRF